MIHALKIWPEPFELLRLGVKTCEVRRQSDRTFMPGDVLLLREWHPGEVRSGSADPGKYTGRQITAHVTELLHLDAAPRAWGIQIEGSPIVVMSLRVLERPPGGPRRE